MAKDIKALISRLEREAEAARFSRAEEQQRRKDAQETFTKAAEAALAAAQTAACAYNHEMPDRWRIDAYVERTAVDVPPSMTLTISGPYGTREATFRHQPSSTKYTVGFPIQQHGRTHWSTGPYPLEGINEAFMQSLIEAMVSDFYEGR